jgi:hypothetical protein
LQIVHNLYYISVLRNEKIDIRLRALKFNLEQLNLAYNETTRDAVIDSGIEYGKKYPYNAETLNILRKRDELQKSREDKLFFTVFNFTQVYYSLKEYLRKEYPARKEKIEIFYSSRPLGFAGRKEISNDLKHNPSNDLRYGFGQVGEEEKVREGSKLIIRMKYKHTWFYYGIDSVEYCNNLYKELMEFITTEFHDLRSS